MTDNKQLITTFYQSFQKKDYKTMQSCYGENAIFNDEVFLNLNADEVRAMWEMFCVKGKDLQIDFTNVQADENGGSAEWTATYTFSKTNRKVVNHINSIFNIENGKITKHTDVFHFHKWAGQALGITGLLLGWTPMLKSKVGKEARKNLEHYISRK